ncbi:MAG: hypothetical protein ACM3S4_10450 [Burkholderiales bacterium]
MESANIHTFAIMAYKSASFLEDTIKSIIAKNVKSEVYITTSTPSEHIAG